MSNMALNKNNNQSVVRRLAWSGVRTGGRTSLLTVLTIALTAMLVTAMMLQTTGMVTGQKKMLERAQHVIYMNLNQEQLNAIASDERVSSTIATKTGQGVEKNGILIQSGYYEPSTSDMTSAVLLSEGRMPKAMEEIAVDKATLRAFGLPEALDVRITVEFLSGEPETFTVVGLTDHTADGGELSRHMLYHSLSYAEQGPQLAQEPWFLMTRVKGGADMNGPDLQRLVYQLGEDHGVAYQNVNPHNHYITLRTVNTTNVLIYIATAAALVIVSLIVIYSIFYLSVAGRVRQFGQLRTIGMTPKQLRRMVKHEGWLLWGMGTPLGFVFASVLMLLVGPEKGWTATNNLLALVASALVCAVAVRLGVQKPAALAAAVSPIEAARFHGWKEGNARADGKPRSLTPVGLAKVNFFRSFKRQALTMLSLALGGILFMAAAIYVNAWDLEAYSRQGEFEHNEYALHFDYNTENSLENGTSAMQLQDILGEPLQTALLQLPGVESVTEYDGVPTNFRWGDIEAKDILTPIDRENAAGLQTCLEKGVGDYDALVKSGGVYASASGLWKELFGRAPQIGDEIEFSYYNGKTCTVRLPIVAIGSNETRQLYSLSGLFLIPRETADALFGTMDTTKSLGVSMKDGSHTIEQDEQMHALVEQYPQLSLETLTDRMQSDLTSYTMFKGIFLSIGGFVVLFSLVNLLNTLLSGLMARRKQLAMLAALGMTRRQIRNMLNFENLLLSGVNLAAALTLGTLAGWGVCQLMEKIGANYIQFSFPVLWFLVYGLIAVSVPMMITRICLKGFYRESLTERMRTTE